MKRLIDNQDSKTPGSQVAQFNDFDFSVIPALASNPENKLWLEQSQALASAIVEHETKAQSLREEITKYGAPKNDTPTVEEILNPKPRVDIEGLRTELANHLKRIDELRAGQRKHHERLTMVRNSHISLVEPLIQDELNNQKRELIEAVSEVLAIVRKNLEFRLNLADATDWTVKPWPGVDVSVVINPRVFPEIWKMAQEFGVSEIDGSEFDQFSISELRLS